MKKEELIQKLESFIQNNGEHSTLADLPDDPSSGDISLLTAVLEHYPPRDHQNPEAKRKILLREIINYLKQKK